MNAYEFVLALVFLVVVVPLWFRHRHHQRAAATPSPSPEDQNTLNELRAAATRLEDRVRTLERVLDAEAPGWRARV